MGPIEAKLTLMQCDAAMNLVDYDLKEWTAALARAARALRREEWYAFHTEVM